MERLVLWSREVHSPGGEACRIVISVGRYGAAWWCGIGANYLIDFKPAVLTRYMKGGGAGIRSTSPLPCSEELVRGLRLWRFRDQF